MNDLLELGKQYKSTKDRAGFLEIYSNYFNNYKHKEINILEIGIDKGESLKIWRKYFTRANICGIDIMDIKFQIDGVELIKADQTDKKALKGICDKYKGFDIIIDDGGHYSKQIVISLNFLFDYLNDNGSFAVTPSVANSVISSSDIPATSRNTSSVCSPKSGAGNCVAPGVFEN